MNTERYSKLILIQYNTQFNKAIIDALTSLNVEAINNIILELPNKLNVKTATGEQLDKLGALVGLERNFLSKDTYLDDETYRFFINLKIVKNSISSKLVDFEKMLKSFFDNNIRIQDYQDMSISYLLFDLPNNVKSILINHKDLLPAPAGVAYYLVIEIVPPVFSYLDYETLLDQGETDFEKLAFFQDVETLEEATMNGNYLDYYNFL